MRKLAYVIIVLIFASLKVSADFDCPIDDDFNCLDGIYASSEKCNEFYQCQFCQNIADLCTNGVFDPLNGVCVEAPDTWCNVNQTVFSVSTLYDNHGPVDPIIMHDILVNYGFDYSTDSGLYTAPSDGTYFFHLSAGSEPTVPILLYMEGLPFSAGILVNGTSHGTLITSRSAIANLDKGDQVGVVLQEGSSLDDDIAGWSGFRIDDFMDPVCAFHASNDEGFANETATIPFPNITTNCQDALDSEGVFTAPEDGIYVFAFSSGLQEDGLRASFVLDSNTLVSELVDQGPQSGFDIETTSKIILYEMTAGQKMAVVLDEGLAVASPNPHDHLLSFSGFLFRPNIPLISQYAWSLHSTQDQTGPKDFMPFDAFDVDSGANYGAGRIYVTASGYYFISISIVSTDALTNATVVRKNLVTQADDVIMFLEEVRPPTVLYNTVSRSTLVYLEDGDQVRVNLLDGTTAKGDINKGTSFSGFMVQRFQAPAPP